MAGMTQRSARRAQMSGEGLSAQEQGGVSQFGGPPIGPPVFAAPDWLGDLAQTIEAEIIPRLMLAHRVQREGLALPLSEGEHVAQEDVIPFAELVLHGHARDARLDAIAGPREPIPCLCVPSSSALPNPKDQGARWHRLRLMGIGGDLRAEVTVRRWSVDSNAFMTDAVYELCLPRSAPGTAADNPAL